MDARYRSDYPGEFVILETKWSGGKKSEQREWIPNPIENHHLSTGDIIITTPPSKKLPQVGDVIAYEARRFNGDVVGIFSHRIIDGDAETGFIVKGDNNKAPDTQKPTLGDISGVVIFVIPYIGTFLTRRALFIIIPTLIGLWLVMDAMKNAE